MFINLIVERSILSTCILAVEYEWFISDTKRVGPVTASLMSTGPYTKKLQITVPSSLQEAMFKSVSGIQNTLASVQEM